MHSTFFVVVSSSSFFISSLFLFNSCLMFLTTFYPKETKRKRKKNDKPFDYIQPTAKPCTNLKRIRFLLFGVCIFEKLKYSEITSVVMHYVLTSCVSPFVQKGPQIQVFMFHECIAEYCWMATDMHRRASRKATKEEVEGIYKRQKISFGFRVL